jgi:hypothetical protein
VSTRPGRSYRPLPPMMPRTGVGEVLCVMPAMLGQRHRGLTHEPHGFGQQAR